jgi:NADH:ubiquinone oxidoreductase subunit 2 (subunit N)
MGLLLMPLCANASGARVDTTNAIGSLWAYMILYTIMNLGVWALIMWPMTRPTGGQKAGPQYIWDLKALNQSSATAAFAWAVLVTSLAGLPPVYGFLGKAAILLSSLNNELLVPVFIALLYT